MPIFTTVGSPEFLRSMCQNSAKLAQEWLVCAPLGIHLEAINKRVNAVSDIIKCIIWIKERTVQCQTRTFWANRTL